MPEVRVDPLSGLRSIIAGDRVNRPGGGLQIGPPDRQRGQLHLAIAGADLLTAKVRGRQIVDA